MEAPANRGAPGTARGSSGLTLQVTSLGRVQDYTLTSAFQSAITLRSPADGGSVPTNQGDEGITSIFRWSTVPDAECYDLQLSLNEDFTATDGGWDQPEFDDYRLPERARGQEERLDVDERHHRQAPIWCGARATGGESGSEPPISPSTTILRS